MINENNPFPKGTAWQMASVLKPQWTHNRVVFEVLVIFPQLVVLLMSVSHAWPKKGCAVFQTPAPPIIITDPTQLVTRLSLTLWLRSNSHAMTWWAQCVSLSWHDRMWHHWGWDGVCLGVAGVSETYIWIRSVRQWTGVGIAISGTGCVWGHMKHPWHAE